MKASSLIYYQNTYNTTTQFYFRTKLGGNAAPRSRIGCNGPASGGGEGNRGSIRSVGSPRLRPGLPAQVDRARSVGGAESYCTGWCPHTHPEDPSPAGNFRVA